MKPPKVTQKQIAQALGISTRRVTQLIKDGMPCDSIQAAIAWRSQKQSGDSTAEALRAERIRLLRAQAERHETENEVRRGQLLELGQVKADCLIVCGKARDRFLKMSNDLPPRLEGLSANKLAKVLHDEVTLTLENLRKDFQKLYSAQDGQ